MTAYTTEDSKANFCPYCMSKVQPGEVCKQCSLKQGSYTPAPHHIPPGTILMDRYLIGRVLGEGGFGITYIGCDLRLESKVAIKEYFPVDQVSRYADSGLSVITRTGRSRDSYSQGIRRFLKEARSLARMEKQTAVVAAKDFFEANNTAYIVMEYIQGVDLKTLVAQRGGRLSAQELFPMIEPLFAALDAVHQTGLIHRDISPDNIMLEKGNVRLLDFGCARESIKGTETMTVALKQGYAPVEQYQRKGQGPWTDVYALAAVVYFCLTGKVPPAALDRILEDELVPPRQLGANITAEQERALIKALSISGKRRYQSVATFYEALYHSAPPGVPPPPPPPPPPPLPDPRIRKWAIGAAAAVLVLIAVIAGIGMGGNRDTPDPSAPATTTSPIQASQPKELQENVTVSDESSFVNALEDARVLSITIAPGCMVELMEQTVVKLTKPLYLAAGSRLNMGGLLTVEGGSHIQVDADAYLYVEGMLYTAQGGTVTAKSGGMIDVFQLWVEQDEALTVEDGANILGYLCSGKSDLYENTKYKILPSDSLFDGGTRVSTWEELVQAIRSRAASVTVASGSDLWLQETLTLKIPLLIEDGASVSIASGCHLELSDTLLVNRGTLSLAAEPGQRTLYGSGAFELYNYGTLDANLTFSEGEEGCFVNQGLVTCRTAEVVTGVFYNLGTIDFYEASFDFKTYTANYGQWNVQKVTEGYGFNVHEFDNAGSVTLGENVVFCNLGEFSNIAGSVASAGTGARLINEGILLTTSRHAGISLLHENSSLEGEGLLVYWEDGISLLGELETTGNTLLLYDCYGNDDLYLDDRADAAAIASAFSGSSSVVINCDLNLTGDWTITAPTLVWGNLTVEGDLAVKGGNLICGTLSADSLTLTDGAVVYADCGADLPGGASLEDSTLYCAYGETTIQTALELRSSHLGLWWGPNVENATVSLTEGSQVDILRPTAWSDCDSITISKDSMLLLNAGFTVERSTLTNYGRIHGNMWCWTDTVCLYADIDNYGVINVLEGMNLAIGGTLRNYGELYTCYRNGFGGLIVTGRLENYGTHYHDFDTEIVTQGGTTSGNKPIPWKPDA